MQEPTLDGVRVCAGYQALGHHLQMPAAHLPDYRDELKYSTTTTRDTATATVLLLEVLLLFAVCCSPGLPHGTSMTESFLTVSFEYDAQPLIGQSRVGFADPRPTARSWGYEPATQHKQQLCCCCLLPIATAAECRKLHKLRFDVIRRQLRATAHHHVFGVDVMCWSLGKRRPRSSRRQRVSGGCSVATPHQLDVSSYSLTPNPNAHSNPSLV